MKEAIRRQQKKRVRVEDDRIRSFPEFDDDAQRHMEAYRMTKVWDDPMAKFLEGNNNEDDIDDGHSS